MEIASLFVLSDIGFSEAAIGADAKPQKTKDSAKERRAHTDSQLALGACGKERVLPLWTQRKHHMTIPYCN